MRRGGLGISERKRKERKREIKDKYVNKLIYIRDYLFINILDVV